MLSLSSPARPRLPASNLRAMRAATAGGINSLPRRPLSIVMHTLTATLIVVGVLVKLGT